MRKVFCVNPHLHKEPGKKIAIQTTRVVPNIHDTFLGLEDV